MNPMKSHTLLPVKQEQVRNEVMTDIAKAAMALANVRRGGARLERFDSDCKPDSLADAYSIQDAVVQLFGDLVGGWKVGAMSYRHPSTSAPLLGSRIVPSPAIVPSDEESLLGIEAEIAFKFARGFGPRDKPYELNEVLAAVESVHPVIEILESRFKNILMIDRLSAVADNISNGYLVTGPIVPNWRDLNLQFPSLKITNHGRLFAMGIGNNGGDPYRLLVELVNHAANDRSGLKAGAIVTTGTCTGILFCEPGALIVADFKNMGRVEVDFSMNSLK